MMSLQYTETKYMFTIQETAKMLGVSSNTVYKLVGSGELAAIKISLRKTVIKAEEIEIYINQK